MFSFLVFRVTFKSSWITKKPLSIIICIDEGLKMVSNTWSIYVIMAAIELEAEEETDEEETLAASDSSRPKTKKGRKKKVRQENAEDETGPCPVCSYKHKLELCRTFLKLAEPEKREVVRKNGICYKCLTRGHIAMHCQDVVNCGVCGGNHHTAFHREVETKEEEVPETK